MKIVRPIYPEIARQTQVEGRVSLDCFIGTDGLVQKIEVKKGHPLLIQAATDAVAQWKFKPMVLNGKAVEMETVISIDFQLSPTVDKADGIIVEKALRTMKLMRNGKVLKTYQVALSTVPIGPKDREGDHKVPEGQYIVDAKNSHSRFHLALHISYPNESDRQKARKLGVRPGGDIEIHGLGKYGLVGSLHRQVDWTDGCIAVTNSEIDEIWPLVAVGTPVEIRP